MSHILLYSLDSNKNVKQLMATKTNQNVCTGFLEVWKYVWSICFGVMGAVSCCQTRVSNSIDLHNSQWRTSINAFINELITLLNSILAIHSSWISNR